MKEINKRNELLVKELLGVIGENPNRAGLVDTPKRVVKMWDEIFSGYDLNNAPKITTFMNNDDGIKYDQMITDTGDFYSHCEHHMVPFFGQYWFAYIPHPDGQVLGLSKIARVVDYFSHRLQVQERLTHDIVNYIKQALTPDHHTAPLGIALVMKGEHLCKTMRGAKKKGTMTTSVLTGEFRKNEVMNEFLNLIKL